MVCHVASKVAAPLTARPTAAVAGELACAGPAAWTLPPGGVSPAAQPSATARARLRRRRRTPSAPAPDCRNLLGLRTMEIRGRALSSHGGRARWAGAGGWRPGRARSDGMARGRRLATVCNGQAAGPPAAQPASSLQPPASSLQPPALKIRCPRALGDCSSNTLMSPCSVPLVLNASPPSIRATPVQSVNAPPASCRMGTSAQQSHGFMAGSIIASSRPLATRQWP